MVSIVSLWLPILLSAVAVFFLSFVFHMLLPFHRSDYAKLPAEDEAMEALRKLGIPPGDYMVPCAGSPEVMKDPAFKQKFEQGPVLMMTVMKPGRMSMGKNLAQWFIYCLIVGVLAAYMAGRALEAGAPYLRAFRFAGTTAFIGYTLALWQDSIWYQRKWSTTIRNSVDGLVYGLVTGGMFGWLWPR